MKKNFRRYVLTIYLLTLAVVSHAQVPVIRVFFVPLVASAHGRNFILSRL